MIESDTYPAININTSGLVNPRMTFFEYLMSIGVSNDTKDIEGIIYKIMDVMDKNMDYRTLSVIVSTIPKATDRFEQLWYQYEDTLDRLHYEKELINNA